MNDPIDKESPPVWSFTTDGSIQVIFVLFSVVLYATVSYVLIR